ncbi:MAG TPA: cytochrome c biogenesis protein CcdA, partial [Armatimonadota bacterium]|nr:cytochrome c biogenesis protein CcdA [Armatimonadota bacterium]
PWHIYGVTKATAPDGTGPYATKVELLPGEALTAAGAVVSPPAQPKFDKGFKINVEVYEGGVALGLPVKVAEGVAGAQTAVVKVKAQACEEGRCLRPDGPELPVSFTVAPGPARPDRVAAVTTPPAQPADYKGGGGASAAITSPAVAPAGDVAGQIETAKRNGLWAFLWLSFTAGLAALLTPCVFPMIPITVSFFTKQQENSPGSGLKSAAAYCFGIVATFTVLGVLVSLLFGAGAISKFATHPVVNLALAALFIVMAINLFGGFEIILPGWLIDKTQSRSQGSGLMAPMLMGLTFTLTSFTCTVAFVGTILATTSQGDLWWPVLGMLAFSTAFASPFFLLALFPQWLAKMPKSGGWLVTVKGYMGFLELAAALKFLSNADLVWQLGLITQPVFLAVWFAIAAAAGFYLLGYLRLPHDSVAKVGWPRRLLGIGTLAAGVACLGAINGASLGQFSAFFPPEPYPGKAGPAGEGEVAWLEDYDKALAKAKADNKPLFIDFTGVTCTNCRDMEYNVFNKGPVVEEFKNFVTVKLYTDKDDAQSEQYAAMQLKRFGQTTLPLYVVLAPDEQKLGEYAYNTDVNAFVRFLKQSRSGQMASKD